MPRPTVDLGKPAVPGFYHEVSRGQTLWNLSKMYNISLDSIIKANYLPDSSKLEVGQLIFIPEVKEKALVSKPARSVKSESFVWPINGKVVSYFGSMKDMTKNKGIDIQSAEGANVVASRSGSVTFADDRLKGYGKTIIIDHQDGYQTVYAHNSQNLVQMNQNVGQGEVVAKVGRSGRANDPTLHFEIRKNHQPQNPFYYLP
ncbi:MAG: LysM peptidoglycan-binding domain-containing M23 family metallopeptidase [Candidatus Omnitrophota bacterium]